MNNKEFLLKAYKSYRECKDNIKGFLKINSTYSKEFAQNVLNDKKQKANLNAYIRYKFQTQIKSTNKVHRLMQLYLSFISDNTSTEELDEAYKFLVVNIIEKNKLVEEIKEIVESCEVTLGRQKNEIQVFLSYHYQKEKKDYSPIDSIEEFEYILQ